MKADSLDLRQKIVETYKAGGISQRELAQRFRVALSFGEKILLQDRDTGDLAPKVCTQQTPSKLTPEQLTLLAQIVADHKDATLEEIRTLLAAPTGVSIGRSTVDRLLKKLNLTRKKTHCTPAKRKVSASNRHGQITGS